jgi:hypothetical protein
MKVFELQHLLLEGVEIKKACEFIKKGYDLYDLVDALYCNYNINYYIDFLITECTDECEIEKHESFEGFLQRKRHEELGEPLQ